MKVRQLFQAVVSVFVVAPLYLTYSFWFKRLMYGSSNLAVANLFESLLLVAFAVGAVGSVAGVAVIAWYDGNRASVVAAGILFAVAPLTGGTGVGTEFFFLYVPLLPSLTALILIGIEWSYRRRSILSDFVGTRLGKATVVVGMTHVVAGFYAQAVSRSLFHEVLIGFLTVPLFAVVSKLGNEEAEDMPDDAPELITEQVLQFGVTRNSVYFFNSTDETEELHMEGERTAAEIDIFEQIVRLTADGVSPFFAHRGGSYYFEFDGSAYEIRTT